MSVELEVVASPEHVADQFDRLVTFTRRFDKDRKVIAAAQFPLSQATVVRLGSLLEAAQPAADIRMWLAGLEPGRLMAGLSVWLTRQTPTTATERAAAVWANGQLAFEVEP